MSLNNHGSSVAIDGNTIVVGTAWSDYVHLYRDWIYETRLRPASVVPAVDAFGFSVDVSGDSITVGDSFEASSGRVGRRLRVSVGRRRESGPRTPSPMLSGS